MSELKPAKPPFTMHQGGRLVLDSDGDCVLACSDIAPKCSLWKDENFGDVLPACPKCNWMWIGMEFATPQDCGIDETERREG